MGKRGRVLLMNQETYPNNLSKLRFFLLTFVLFFVSQSVDYFIVKHNMHYSRNFGVSFGFLSNINMILLVFVYLFSIYFLVIKSTKNHLFASSLILSGGLSNLADRYFLGFVPDYIKLPLKLMTLSFNLSDLYIALGAVCFIYYQIKTNEYKRNNI